MIYTALQTVNNLLLCRVTLVCFQV